MPSEYQQEQSRTRIMIRRLLAAMGPGETARLGAGLKDYLRFRDTVDRFLQRHFGAVCTRRCYQSRLSACCSREGIITFFADMVIDALVGGDAHSASLLEVLDGEGMPGKCIYLGDSGCRWRVKPIVCQMFLCERAERAVFDRRPDLESRWRELERERKGFTWPDRPVLFDDLERVFMEMGCSSPLMYLHLSPGLLRVKGRAGRRPPA